MKRLIGAGLALQLFTVPGFAQTNVPVTPGPASGSASPGGVAGGFAGAITPSTPEPANTVNGDRLVKGANSFTEGQARSRLERNGYGQVSRLTKDNDGIWRGSAMKNGSAVRVSVDFKGDISRN